MLIKAVDLCEELQGYVSRDLLEELLAHCEQAIDWLETQESLIKDASLADYLQSHMSRGSD